MSAGDDPARRSRADGPILGEGRLDRCHARLAATFAEHRDRQLARGGVVESFHQPGDALVDLASENAVIQRGSVMRVLAIGLAVAVIVFVVSAGHVLFLPLLFVPLGLFSLGHHRRRYGRR